MSSLTDIGAVAKEASYALAGESSEKKNRALRAMASSIADETPSIIRANQIDVGSAADAGVSGALLDRLKLDERRIEAMLKGIDAVADQPDPIGTIIDSWVTPAGLEIEKTRVPLGVVAVIYEARPNVTSDIAALCLKSGNAAVLRGSSQALNTNKVITRAICKGLASADIPDGAVRLIEDTSRESALELMRLDGYIDLLVPRGGRSLLDSIKESATVPFIIDGDGNCHVYIDSAADKDMATSIIVNAKTQRPGVCNAAETLLVHSSIANDWLPSALESLESKGVEIRGDHRVVSIWPSAKLADESDWETEYLDLILAVKVVDSIDEAIAHIRRWGTSNAEAIVTQDEQAAQRFAREIDSGTVFINASTRFSDGGQFGFGAEIGISTQKLHARGPMGLEALTTYKFVAKGKGQVRN